MCPKHYTRWRRHGDAEATAKPGNKPGVPHSWSRRGVENKTTAKASMSPSLADIAWAAGFLEGEGSFVRRGSSFTSSAAQVSKEPLYRLLAMFGGSIRQHAPASGKRQQAWAWLAHGARGRGVAFTVYSFLSTRRQEQIRNALIDRIIPETPPQSTAFPAPVLGAPGVPAGAQPGAGGQPAAAGFDPSVANLYGGAASGL